MPHTFFNFSGGFQIIYDHSPKLPLQFLPVSFIINNMCLQYDVFYSWQFYLNLTFPN